jgi:hypothetical protein
MSSADKIKLDGIESGANAYSLPTAKKGTLGGVTTTSDVISSTGYTACPIISGVPYYLDAIYMRTAENEDDDIPDNALIIVDTTESDLTGGGGSGIGSDGYSPTVQISTITGGHKVTITDKNGAKSFNVMNGANGTTPVKGTHYWTTSDKNEIITEVLAQIPNGNEVAY